MGNWPAIDLLAFAVLGVSVLAGLLKGLARELLSLAAVLLGFFLAAAFYGAVSNILTSIGVDSSLAGFLGFTGIFLAALVAALLVRLLVEKILKTFQLKGMDRLLGGLFGVVRGYLVVGTIFMALTSFPATRQLLFESKSAEFFLAGTRLLVALTPQDLKDRFHEGYRQLYQLWLEKSLEAEGHL